MAEIAGTELLGGGSEDPIADAVVVGEIAAADAESAVAAAEGGGATDFVVTSNGDVIPVPEGASGPNEVANSAGFQYNNGAGGNGLASNVTDVRIMDPTPQNPTGYVNYGSRQSNGGWQSVNPYTGQSVPTSSSWWHIPINNVP